MKQADLARVLLKVFVLLLSYLRPSRSRREFSKRTLICRPGFLKTDLDRYSKWRARLNLKMMSADPLVSDYQLLRLAAKGQVENLSSQNRLNELSTVKLTVFWLSAIARY